MEPDKKMNIKKDQRRNMRYTIEEKKNIIKILQKRDFHVRAAIKEFNTTYGQSMSPTTFYKLLKKDVFFINEYNLRRKELLEESEQLHRVLRRGIPIKDEETGEIIAWQEKPDRAAIEFHLRAKGRLRGHKESININQNTTISENAKLTEEELIEKLEKLKKNTD